MSIFGFFRRQKSDPAAAAMDCEKRDRLREEVSRVNQSVQAIQSGTRVMKTMAGMITILEASRHEKGR